MTRSGGPAWALLAVLVAAVGCGSPEPLELPAPTEEQVASPAVTDPGAPSGTATVAYPDVPTSWVGAEGDDPAATDLAALWGLPLFRYGPDGALRPGLVASSTTGEDENGWTVELTLRSGRWSDGEPVTARDVVASVEALRVGPREAEFAVVETVEAVGDDQVRLTFESPYARWPHLLSGAPGVLPAHVLEDAGMAVYEAEIPVSGGWFALEEFEPGRRAVFVAHEEGPLGPPHLQRVEVWFSPHFETSLGLLDEGRVDVVAGHLALNPRGRAARLGEQVDSEAPIGGTVVALEWPDEDVAVDIRRALSEVIDVAQLVEGLLGPVGEVATSPWPGVAGPWEAGRTTPGTSSFGTLRLLLPRWHEVTGFTARALQRDLDRLEGTLETVSEETPSFTRSARGDTDVVLRIRRDGPRPSLARMVGAVTPEVRAADAASLPDDPAVQAGFEEVAEQARMRPLYQVGVAHVWSATISGIRPSSWPGVVFWNAGEWRRDDG